MEIKPRHADNHHAEFLRLFLSTEVDLRSFIRTLVRDPRDVDDVCQSVAVVLWEKFTQYDRERSFGAWARGIAAKEVLAMRKKNGRSPTPFSPEVIAALKDGYERNLGTRSMPSERAEALDHCVDSLPAASRTLLEYRYGQVLSLHQVADRVGRSLAATQRALSRVPRRLLECIETRLAIISGGGR